MYTNRIEIYGLSEPQEMYRTLINKFTRWNYKGLVITVGSDSVVRIMGNISESQFERIESFLDDIIETEYQIKY